MQFKLASSKRPFFWLQFGDESGSKALNNIIRSLILFLYLGLVFLCLGLILKETLHSWCQNVTGSLMTTSNKLNSNRKRRPIFFHEPTKSFQNISHWPNLSHVPNSEPIIGAMRLESTDWPISGHYLSLEISQPSCGE